MRTEKTQKSGTGRYVRWGCVATGIALGLWLLPGLVQASGGYGSKKSDKAKVVTVKGEVVDLWCYMDHKGRGEQHRSCAVTCAEAGNPIGIVEESGNLYIAMGGKKHQPGRDVLIDHMAETVTVTGKLIKDGGLQAIYVSSVKK